MDKNNGMGERTRFLIDNPAFVNMFCKRFRLHRDEWDDFSQFLIMQSLKRSDNFDEAEGMITTYAGSFCKSMAFLFIKSQKKANRCIPISSLCTDDEKGEILAEILYATSDSNCVEDTEEREYSREIIAWVLDKLGDEYTRDIYPYLKGWKTFEIAKWYGVSRAAVSVHCRTFSKKVPEILKQYPMKFQGSRYWDELETLAIRWKLPGSGKENEPGFQRFKPKRRDEI